MLVNQNKFDKKQSIYKCDRCKKQLNWENKVAIYTAPPRCSPKKKYDFCLKCYRLLIRGVEKKEG